MTKLTLYLATQNLPFEGSSLKVKLGDEELGTTEVQAGPDAIYETTFPIDYDEGGDAGGIWIEVLDGSGEERCTRSFDLGDILSANRCRAKARKLSPGGVLVAHLSSAKVKGDLRLQLSGEGFKNLDGLFNKSDPFFLLMAKDEGSGRWRAAYRSETVKNDLSPEWDEFRVGLADLGGRLDRPLGIVVCDEDDKKKFNFQKLSLVSKTEEESMGCAKTTVGELLEGGSLPLIHDGKEHGRIVVGKAELVGHVDPAGKAGAAMEAAGRAEAARIGAAAGERAAEEARGAMREAEEALRSAEGELEERRRALEEALATLDGLDLEE